MPEIDLSSTELFQNIAPEDLDALLKCLDVRKKHYQKGEILFLEGAPTSNLGIVLSGRIMIEMGDAWGGRSILGTIGPGGTFAEAYACIPGEPLLVTVSAAEDTSVMLVNASRVLTVCLNGCEFHSILIQNLLTLCARKNLQLSRRMQHTAQKIHSRAADVLFFPVCQASRKPPLSDSLHSAAAGRLSQRGPQCAVQ